MAIDNEGGIEENRNEDIPDELPDNRKTRGGHMWKIEDQDKDIEK